jgi:hypothetical protein
MILTNSVQKPISVHRSQLYFLKHLPRRPLVHFTHLFNHCIRLSHFPDLEWSKLMTSPKPGKDPKFPQTLCPISILTTTGKLFEKAILKIIKRHLVERDLLNASKSGFRARHSTTLQCMRLTYHVTLNFNNNVYGFGIVGYRKSLWHTLAPRPAI